MATPTPDTSTRSVDALLRQLEDAMVACCDQPLACDFMTLTRSWRGILEAARYTSPAPANDNRTAAPLGEPEKGYYDTDIMDDGDR